MFPAFGFAKLWTSYFHNVVFLRPLHVLSFARTSTFSACIMSVLFKTSNESACTLKEGRHLPICRPWLSFTTLEDNVQHSCLSLALIIRFTAFRLLCKSLSLKAPAQILEVFMLQAAQTRVCFTTSTSEKKPKPGFFMACIIKQGLSVNQEHLLPFFQFTSFELSEELEYVWQRFCACLSVHVLTPGPRLGPYFVTILSELISV